MINQAMVLCAGMGSRMGELTKDIPKPMVVVDGMSLIERHMHYLIKNNIKKLVINTFYKAEVLQKFITSLDIYNKFDQILFSRENELLGTAGGVKNALRLLEDKPFFVINNDSIFIDKENAFTQLESDWDSNIMPMRILITKKENSFGYWLKGDFDMDDKGRLNQNNDTREYINPGMYIMDYKLFDKYKEIKLDFYHNMFKDLMKENNLSLGVRVSQQPLQYDGKILSVPIYMVSEISRLVHTL